MFYSLNQEYILRGYQGMTCLLVHRSAKGMLALNQLEFRVLLLCDGITDLDRMPLTADEQTALQNMLKKSVVTVTEQPSPLTENQIYRYHDNRFVKSVFWSITGRCNFRCRHCYMDAPNGALGEMTHEDAMRLIDEMAECGVLKVDITGGEPFVRKDFWQLIDRMLEHGITIGQIYTNGWILNDHILDEFELRGLKPEFSISFDGLGWHDWMRGISGAEQRALDAFALLQRRGFPCTAEMCIHKGNAATLRETVLKLSELGVLMIKTSGVSPTELWLHNCQENAMTDEEYLEAMLEYLPHYFEDGMPCSLMLSTVITLKKGSTDYQVIPERHSGTEKQCLNSHLCGAVRAYCYINPEGRMLPCMPVASCDEQRQFPRVQDIGLKKGLSDSFYMRFVNSRVKDLLAANEECNACPYKLKCGGGCRAHALMKTHDLMGKDPGLCMLWQNNYPARIREVADAAIAKYCTPKEPVSHEG